MRAKNRKHVKVPQLPHPEPTLRELAEKAVALFNYGGDKTRYIAFLKRYSPAKEADIVREMQKVWRGTP